MTCTNSGEIRKKLTLLTISKVESISGDCNFLHIEDHDGEKVLITSIEFGSIIRFVYEHLPEFTEGVDEIYDGY